MKKLIVSIFASLAILLSPLTASASHSWFIRMSDPTTSNQVRTFNVEYTALSVVNTDHFTVKLMENGVQKATQTTPGGGNSGAFSVSVPSDGLYTYRMEATSSQDGTTKTTPDKTVKVDTAPGSSTSTVTPVSSAGTTDGAGGRGSGTAAAAIAAAAGTGQTGTEGQVSDQAALTNAQGDVLGAEAKQGFFSKDNAPTLAIFILAALALAYYYFYRHRRASSEDIDL